MGSWNTKISVTYFSNALIDIPPKKKPFIRSYTFSTCWFKLFVRFYHLFPLLSSLHHLLLVLLIHNFLVVFSQTNLLLIFYYLSTGLYGLYTNMCDKTTLTNFRVSTRHFQVKQKLFCWSQCRYFFQDKCNLLLRFIAGVGVSRTKKKSIQEKKKKEEEEEEKLIKYLILCCFSSRFGFANKLISIKS